MLEPFEPFEHTADLGYFIRGQTLEDLFCHGVWALYDAAGLGEASGPLSQEETLSLDAADLVDLFHDWLDEMLFLMEVRRLRVSEIHFQALTQGELESRFKTLPVSPDGSRTEIKAVTYHELTVEQAGGSWQARVVFDV